MTGFLQVSDLSVTIADKLLLSDINFTVPHGDYVCIVGPNGAGKSTLLKAIMAMIKPSSGQISLDHKNIDQLQQKSLARHISYVPQAHKQTLLFNVADFIKMGRYPYHNVFSDWSEIDQHAFEHAIEITQTKDYLSRQIQTLSGGEAQRVMIAAALCQQTPLLLLDEPTSFLDPHHQVEVHHLITQLNQQHNISIIEVSHDLNHAAQHSQHIVALKQGQLTWHGQSEQFLQAERLQQLYEQEFVFTSHPQTGATIALPSELI